MKKLSTKVLRNSAIGVGVCVVLLFVLSQEIPGAQALESVSKTVESTGMVLLPVFGLNLDLFADHRAKAAGIAVLVTHAALLLVCNPALPELNYITITPIALLEMFILEIPFLIIRKRLAQ